MKFILVLISASIPFIVFSQKEAQKCTKTYFKNGKLSTIECMPESGWGGKAYAFNQKGDTIGQWSISRMHMVAGVYFTFHANGGVHKADYSSHPDAGIQWHRSYTVFNEEGVKVDYWEMNHDDRVTVLQEPIFKPEKKEEPKPEKPIKQEVIECAIIYSSEFWVDNRLTIPVKVTWQSVSDSTNKGEVLVPKGQREMITYFILAEQYDEPLKGFRLKISTVKGKELDNVKLSKPLIDESRLREHKKGYVYMLEEK
jgi:hypothetical protein